MDEAALLAAIAARPADDTPRLVYADWLDDHDQPARAEFVRVQCEVARLDHMPSAQLQGYADLYRRQDALFAGQRRALLGPLADQLGPHDVTFDRGFITEIGLSDAAFLANASALARILPLPDFNVTAMYGSVAFFDSPHVALITAVRFRTLELAPGETLGTNYDPAYRTWKRLRVMNISGCGTESWLNMVSSLEDLYPALTDLDVSWNVVTDEDVGTLVESRLWPRLRVLVQPCEGAFPRSIRYSSLTL